MSHSTQRVALVTGSARGIGAAIAVRLAQDGFAVALNDRVASPELEAAVAATGSGNAAAFPADVADEAAVAGLVEDVVERFGGLHVLVNNAALTDVLASLEEIDRAAFDTVIAVNLTGSFMCARAAAAHMRAAGWGRIVNVGSVTFDIGDPRFAHYVASKGGVVGLTRALARELAPGGVTVNAVSPGAIATPHERDLFPDIEELESDLYRRQAIQRRGTPEDIAGAVAFLVSDDAAFVTGQTLLVDGGWAMH